MESISDEDVTDVDELLARISEAISEKCDFRTEYLRNRLSVERIVQRLPASVLEPWMSQELEKWNVADHPQVAHILSLAQECWSNLSPEMQSFIEHYCEARVWVDTDDVLFNQIGAEIMEGYGQ